MYITRIVLYIRDLFLQQITTQYYKNQCDGKVQHVFILVVA